MPRFLKKKKNIEGLGNKEFETESFILISDKEDAFISMLKNSISVDVDDKTGLIIVSSTTPDPYVSAILTDTVGKRLQSYITRYRTTKAKLDYDYFDKMSDEAETKYKNSLNAYADNVDSNMLAVLQRVKGKQEKLESDVALAAQVYTQLKQKKELAKAKIQEETGFCGYRSSVCSIKNYRYRTFAHNSFKFHYGRSFGINVDSRGKGNMGAIKKREWIDAKRKEKLLI